MTYTTFGSEGATATPMRPISFGRPLVCFVQVSPPSTLRHTPPSSSPLVKVQGLRSKRQSAAKSSLGFFGLRSRSATPWRSSR